MENNQIAVVEPETVEVVPAKRGRGRPKGSVNKATKFLHYHPKKWEPWMDSLVLASISGLSNKLLAERYEISETHVSNLLCTPQAEDLKKRVTNQLLSKSGEALGAMERIATKALQTVEKALDNEGFVESSPYSSAMVAMKAFEMVKGKGVGGIGVEEKDNKTIINGNVLIANPQYMDNLTKAMQLSNEIKERNAKFIEENPGGLKLVANG